MNQKTQKVCLKQKVLKHLKITGIIVGSIVVLIGLLALAVRFTTVGKYITFDLLSLIGMLLVSLLMLAAIIAFIVGDLIKMRQRRKNSFSGVQNAMDIITEAFHKRNE